jgi:hypothetical protein
MQTEVVSNMTGLAALPLEGNFRVSSSQGGREGVGKSKEERGRKELHQGTETYKY